MICNDHGLDLRASSVEEIASGWAIQRFAKRDLKDDLYPNSMLLRLVNGRIDDLTAEHLAEAAEQNDACAMYAIGLATCYLAWAIQQVIVLLCPRRIIIGGGVSRMGEKLLFEPLRRYVAKIVFEPFADSYDIVPAALGEEVVVHGALALARKRFAS
jgi:glucokinase